MSDSSRYSTAGQRLMFAIRSGLGAGIGAFVAALLASFDPQNPLVGALVAGGVIGGMVAVIQFAALTYRAGKEEHR